MEPKQIRCRICSTTKDVDSLSFVCAKCKKKLAAYMKEPPREPPKKDKSG